jgi:hypothetical protein
MSVDSHESSVPKVAVHLKPPAAARADAAVGLLLWADRTRRWTVQLDVDLSARTIRGYEVIHVDSGEVDAYVDLSAVGVLSISRLDGRIAEAIEA